MRVRLNIYAQNKGAANVNRLERNLRYGNMSTSLQLQLNNLIIIIGTCMHEYKRDGIVIAT